MLVFLNKHLSKKMILAIVEQLFSKNIDNIERICSKICNSNSIFLKSIIGTILAIFAVLNIIGRLGILNYRQINHELIDIIYNICKSKLSIKGFSTFANAIISNFSNTNVSV